MKKIFILVIVMLFFQNTVFSQDAFITTWQTTEANESITIPTTGAGYDYTINWGDGTIESNQTGDATHVFATAGVQTISISGDFPRIYFLRATDRNKIQTVEQWGDIVWKSMERAFSGCENLTITNPDIDTPDLSLVTNMSYMFATTYLFDQDISEWNVSNVTNMEGVFNGARVFNQDISNWDVSNVTNMSNMFYSAYLFNKPLDWKDNVSKVIDMSNMFSFANVFNQDISEWNVSNVITIEGMFYDAKAFNQDLSNWDVSKVINMQTVFSGARAFDQPLNWKKTSSVTTMRGMFFEAGSFNQDISEWDMSNVTTIEEMFKGANVFNQDLSNWDVSSVINMRSMFEDAKAFNKPLDWNNTSNVTNMSNMFNGATAFNQDISNWDVSNVINMSSMFDGATVFNQPLNWIDTSSVTNMRSMFSFARAFNQDISNWDVSNVTSMFYMFRVAIAFNQDLSSWDVSSVTNMFDMFSSVTLSTDNYDAILKGWSAQTLQSGVSFHGGNSQYCTAETERQSMIDNFGWTITDDGKGSSPIITTITAIDEENSYTLPTIVGTDLSGNEKYYTGTGGTGIIYEIGDELSYDPSITYPITLYAYDSGSCGSAEQSFELILTGSTASIDDIIISNQIQLYPNPVSSFLNIETNNQLKIKEVYIYNILGSLVKKVNTIEESISLDELSTGSYMMKIITDKGISVKRIIKN